MSRIGKAPISLPSGVTVSIAADNGVTVKGPKGELFRQVDPKIKINVQGDVLTVERHSDEKRYKALHGLYRALLFNMVTGVSQGYAKTLEIVGVGYKATVNGQMLDLSLGFSHNLFIELPK
jgi:large subunit ribosomal protein L6